MILYALYQLLFERNFTFPHVLLIAIPILGYLVTAHLINRKLKRHEIKSYGFKFLDTELTKKIKHAVGITDDKTKKSAKLSVAMVLQFSMQNSNMEQNSMVAENTSSGIQTESKYHDSTKGVTPSKRPTKSHPKLLERQPLPLPIVSTSKEPATNLPVRWNNGGSKKIIMQSEKSCLYPLDIIGGNEFLFFDKKDLAEHERVNILKHILQDGKTISIYSEGKNGIKVYSHKPNDKFKVASAAIKVDKYRVYCRAWEGEFENGQKCVIHFPEIFTIKNKATMAIENMGSSPR